MIIHDPRTNNKESERPTEFSLNIDIPSTVLDLCNVPIPTSYQGASLKPFLNQDIPSNWREEFFCEHYSEIGLELPDWIGIRGADFMFADYTDSQGTGVFYNDIFVDPVQRENLASLEDYSDIIANLKEKTRRYQASYANAGPSNSK